MESAFGADFGGVRVHTGNEAVQMNRELRAQAFTHGSDIYFNAGKYEPASVAGQGLLAHELTHVVQQNSGLATKSIQRFYLTFAPFPRPRGSFVHSTVLPMFVKSNDDLFIEVKIPGAKKMDVDKGKTGIADFYKATPQKTIGIKFDEQPNFLTMDGKLEWGSGHFNHNKDSAPQGTTQSPRVRNLDNGPVSIELGDLKPGGSGEASLGIGQVKDYQDGIANTSKDINTYLNTNPKETTSAKKSWNPGTSAITKLEIPDVLKYPTGKGISRGKLAVYKGESKFPHIPDSSLIGSMFVYKDKGGVWSYEWIPETISATTGSGDVNKVLKRLNTEVIPPLLSSDVAVQPKLMPQPVILSQKSNKKIQRKDEKFRDEEWKTKQYTPWKKEAEKFLGDDKEVKKAQVAAALVELKDRTGGAVPLPQEVEERGQGLSKIGHWQKFGGLYGWLREKFGFIYVKINAFAKKIKNKVKNLSKSIGNTSFGSWFKAAVKVVFKIFKLVGSWAVNQILDKLVDSLREGISNNIKKLVNMFTPEGATSKIEEFEAMKDKYQKLIEEKEEELITRFFGDKLVLFEKLEEIEKVAGDLSTIVTLVEWGVRLLACASPPAIGCLWNLLISALQAAFAWLIQTCWFTKKVYEPIISQIAAVKNFPSEVAAKIVTSANEYVPMPTGFDPLFAPIAINNSDFNVDCDEAGDGGNKLTPERQAILELVKEIGPAKFEALLELANKRGAGPWVLLTVERLAELKKGLEDVSTEDLKKAAQDPQAGVPLSLEDFLKDIKKYSKEEKRLIEENRKNKEGKGKEGKGKEGEEDGSDNSVSPTYGAPPKLTGQVTVLFSAAVLSKKFEVGKEYKEPVTIYLGVGIRDGGKVYSIKFRDVKVKVKIVESNKVVFINEAEFYGNYDADKSVYIEKGHLIAVQNDFLIYVE